jgi:uncharacterized protein YjbJ (UPF0337 family)
MSIARKIAHKAEAVKGAVKKAVGRVTGSRRLRSEGRAGQARGNLKQVGTKASTAGLLLPRLARARPGPDRLRRWVRPQASAGAPAAADPGGNGDQPAPARDTSVQENEPTLVDDLLRYEHPLL